MKLESCRLCKEVQLIRLLLKNYTTSIYITFVGWRTTKWKFKETAITVSSTYRVNFICFFQSPAELLLMTVVHTWSHFILWLYKTCKHGFSYIVFLFLACEYASLLSSDYLFLHLSWNSVVMRFCIFSQKICWCPVPVVGECINFNILSISTQKVLSFCGQDVWIWQGSHYCLHHISSQYQITTFHLTCRHNPPHYCPGVIWRNWVLSIHFNIYFWQVFGSWL
jgi:hypothetical protein